MAKKGKVETNNRRKKLVERHKAKRDALKAVAEDLSVPAMDRFLARQKLAALPRSSSPTRVRNRCELTGRPRGYYRKLGMSRIALREMANQGLIPGMVKSSW